MSAKAAPESKAAQTPEATPARSFTAAPKPLLLRKCACGSSSSGGGGECEECAKAKLPLQRRAAGHDHTGGIPPIVNNVLASPGHPLDAPTRDFMESRFGHDFGGVRLHTDDQAAESARAVNAHAYTVGQDIAFASGKYDPHSDSGKHLLAHELAHTVQQKGLQRSSNGFTTNQGLEYQRLESEADNAAHSVIAGEPLRISARPSAPLLSRSGNDSSEASTDQKESLKKAGFEEMDSPPQGVKGIRRFKVIEAFPLPGTKGPQAKDAWEKRASGGGLESIIDVTGEPLSMLKQARPSPDTLREFWLSKFGWSAQDAGKNWKAAGGDNESFSPPQAGKATCEMDHIIELQVGGTNIKENIQALDKSPNASSGSTIRGYLSQKAKAVRDVVPELKLKEVVLHWDSILPQGAVICDPCCKIEQTAVAGAKTDKGKSSEGDEVVERHPISAGGSSTEILISKEFADKKKNVPLSGSALPENKSASTIIPGLILKDFHRQTVPNTINAEIDTNGKTRIPGMTLKKEGAGSSLKINRAKDGKLSLATKTPNLEFTYQYLSPGKITKLDFDENGGVSWAGYIKPSVAFLGQLDVAYSNGEFKVTKGLDEEKLKSKSFLGAKITKAQVSVLLAPEFKPEGRIEFEIGKQLASGFLTVSKDDVGLVAAGKLKVNIPKLETSETDITYKGGSGREEWKAQIQIKTENIKLGSSVSVTGGFDGAIDKNGITFTGKINATFPGGNTAELGLKKAGTGYVLFGGGTFNFPKIDPVTVKVNYDLAKDKLTATGKTGFKIPAIGLGGRLDEVTFVITKDEPLKVYGKGGLDFKKGKAEGHVDVVLHPNGKFTGKGSLSYQIKENIIVTGTVELNEQEKLRVTGELLITRYELFKKYEKKKELIDPPLNIPIPIPGLSIGTSGLVFLIKGGVGVALSFGPGTLEPLKFSAGFDPLEADPNLELAVTATAKIPASATLSAWVSGSLAVQVDILVGSAGVEGGLKLQGDLTLSAGAFANLEAAYKKKRLTAKVVAGIETKLLLGLALTAYARAWAGAFGITGEVRKDWVLAKKTIDTGIGFSLSAPFEYADDTGVKLPEMKDITLKKPEFDFKRILEQVFRSAPEKKTES